VGRLSRTQSERAAVRRDLVWALLWSLPRLDGTDVGWYKHAAIKDAWLDGRPFTGCAFYPDYIEFGRITSDLRRLVAEGRAEDRRLPRRHPEWRALEP
jgi:hypothetical protein